MISFLTAFSFGIIYQGYYKIYSIKLITDYNQTNLLLNIIKMVTKR